MDYLIYFVITIGILVFVHELGHFLAAKLSKMRVDTFALGFGPRIIGWNKITGFKFGPLPKDFDGNGATDYRISIIPLGGYVKIAGMIDESLDTKYLQTEPKEYEFRAKPTLSKLFVISAGVLMNLFLTILIFWGINFFQGEQVLKTTKIDFVVDANFPANAGFMPNDEIIAINGNKIEHWDEVINAIYIESLNKDLKIELLRNNQSKEIIVSRDLVPDLQKGTAYFNPAEAKPVIEEVIKDMPAFNAGFMEKDIILSINNQKQYAASTTVETINANPGKEIYMSVLRAKDTLNIAVTPNDQGKIGIRIGQLAPFEYRSFGLFESIYLAFSNAVNYTKLTISMLNNVIFGKLEFKQAFGGPIKIAQFAAKSADTGAQSFLQFLALLSLSLAILNILPFPVLDGGHIVIIGIEGIIRREIPVKIKLAIHNAGFALLILLMIFIIYNDLISVF